MTGLYFVGNSSSLGEEDDLHKKIKLYFQVTCIFSHILPLSLACSSSSYSLFRSPFTFNDLQAISPASSLILYTTHFYGISHMYMYILPFRPTCWDVLYIVHNTSLHVQAVYSSPSHMPGNKAILLPLSTPPLSAPPTHRLP